MYLAIVKKPVEFAKPSCALPQGGMEGCRRGLPQGERKIEGRRAFGQAARLRNLAYSWFFHHYFDYRHVFLSGQI
jgi:hypothetical protein